MPSWTVKAALFGIFFIYCIWLAMNWSDMGTPESDEDGVAGGAVTQLLAVLAGAIYFGFLTVVYIIPMIGELSGRFVYSSGEEFETDESMRGAVLIAQGDYEGAIEEFQKKSEKDPEDRFAITEIAKIHLEHLNDPQSALGVLQGALEKEWPADDAAFILFRISDIQSDHVADFEGARATLQAVIEQLPDTRHSANATHKLRELDQMEANAKDRIARGESPIPSKEESSVDPKEAARQQREREEAEFLARQQKQQNDNTGSGQDA